MCPGAMRRVGFVTCYNAAMGVVRCDIHGLSGFAMVCSHLYDAIEAKHVLAYSVVVDARAVRALVCALCMDTVTVTALTGDDVRVGFGWHDDEVEPTCPECLAAWLGPQRATVLRRYMEAVTLFASRIVGPLTSA